MLELVNLEYEKYNGGKHPVEKFQGIVKNNQGIYSNGRSLLYLDPFTGNKKILDLSDREKFYSEIVYDYPDYFLLAESQKYDIRLPMGEIKKYLEFKTAEEL